MTTPRYLIGWEQVEEMAIYLGERLKANGFVPDYVVGISRGGYFPAILINFRVCEGWAATCYFDIKRDPANPAIRIVNSSTFSPDVELSGKKVLLCEDMIETGESLRVVKEWLEIRGAEVRTMSFFTRADSRFQPNFVFLRDLKSEPSFPWERFRDRPTA